MKSKQWALALVATRSPCRRRAGAAVLPHRHRRHRRHLLPGRRHDRQRGLAARQDRRHRAGEQRLGRQRQRPWPVARSKSGFSQADVATWAYKGNGALRRQAQRAGPAPDREPVSRKRARGRAQGLGHQDRRRPEGQARRAGRAGLGHAGQCARDPGRLRPQGIGHQARVHQAQPGRRQDEGRRARRLLLHRRRTGRRHRRAGVGRQRASNCCRSTGTEADALRAASPFFAPDTIAADTYKGVPAVQDAGRAARSGSPATRPTRTRSTRWSRRCTAMPGQKTLAAGHAKGKFITKENAVRGAGIPFHPGAEKFYKEAGLLK